MATGRPHLALLGVLDLRAGEPARALVRFEAFAEQHRAAGFSSSHRDPPRRPRRGSARGRPAADALELLDDWESEARKLGHRWAIPEIVRCRGLAAANAGDAEGAIALLEEAVSLHAAVGDGLGEARALLLLGIAHRRARRKRSARDAIEAAIERFEKIGAPAWMEKARAELGSVGGRTREDGLTPAEQRVAALVAEGRTNREVAAALYLAERTVETHLSHVYAKLGIRSRTELARTMAS